MAYRTCRYCGNLTESPWLNVCRRLACMERRADDIKSRAQADVDRAMAEAAIKAKRPA